MAQSRLGRLKVFAAQIGFFDTVVAAPSQAAALRAWGVRQNLFASGAARTETETDAVAAARASPGIPLRRAAGSGDPFALEPDRLPRVPGLPKAAKALGKVAKPKAVADRSRLKAAEAVLAALKASRADEAAGFEREARDLAARRGLAEKVFTKASNEAEARIQSARRAYVKAGGVPD